MSAPTSDFTLRLRTAARILRWSVGLMVAGFAGAWLAATRQAAALVRISMLAGVIGFTGATLCFIWLAYQAATRRGGRGPR